MKNKLPLVSIIIPTKNEEKNIAGCLDSCLKQDYKNIEVIVVDNDSTDKTKEIAKKYTGKIFNRGPERSSQKNFGAKVARGKYLLFLDADARLTKNVISQCVNLALKRGKKMVIIPERHVGEGFWAQVKALERSFYLGDDAIEAPWFYEKSAFWLVGGYNEEMFAGEDWDLFDRMTENGFDYGRCKSFIDHYIGRLSLIQVLKKKYYYGSNIPVFLNRGARRGFKRNPIIRRSLIKNIHYLFKSPIKYSAIFVLKFLETVGIIFGIIVGLFRGFFKNYSERDLSDLIVNMFYDCNRENTYTVLKKMNRKDWTSFLKLLSANRLLYYFATEILVKYESWLRDSFKNDIKIILSAAKGWITKTEKTLDYLNANLPKAVLVKTYKFLPYITYDLDILVDSSLEKKINNLKRENHPGKQNRYQKNYSLVGFLRIDIHQDFYWQGFKFVDISTMFKKRQKVTYFGREVKIPDYSFEFLLNSAHILFERRYITFLDFWYLKKLVREKKIDWNIIENQARKYNWLSSLKILLREIEIINEVVVGDGRIFPRGLVDSSGYKSHNGVSFPVFLSMKQIAKIYKEKFFLDKKLPVLDIVYYLFARVRGLLGIKTRYPYYLHWFDFRDIK